MEVKLLEVRDRATFISVAAMKLFARNETEQWLIYRAGYSQSLSRQQKYVLLFRLDCEGQAITYDPYRWRGSRTMREAHLWLQEHFDEVTSGDVLDIEYILGENLIAKKTERDTENQSQTQT